jgi:hypothetical protein
VKIAAGEHKARRQIIGRSKGVIGQLREQDAQQRVRERGNVALQRVDTAVGDTVSRQRPCKDVVSIMVDAVGLWFAAHRLAALRVVRVLTGPPGRGRGG